MKLYDLIYKGDGSRKTLVRCELKPEVNLYEIRARLTAREPCVRYYYADYNKRNARARFEKNVPYMKVVGVREVTGEEGEDILTDPLKMPL